eukprot:5570832-Alexandrium_andersonii.AAC.1
MNSAGKRRTAHDTGSGMLLEAISGALRHFPALVCAFQLVCVAEQRLELLGAAPGWLKALL